MKFKRVFLTLILLMFLFPFAAYAAETDGEELYSEQYYDSGADKLTDFLPDGTREYFEKNGIDPSDYGWVGSLSAQSVFSHILEFLKNGAETPLKSGAAIIAVILIAAAFSSAEIKSGAGAGGGICRGNIGSGNYCGTCLLVRKGGGRCNEGLERFYARVYTGICRYSGGIGRGGDISFQ